MSYGNLQEMLEGYEIKHFDAREIARRTLPPRALWARIIPTLQVAERLRAQDEVSYIVVSSGYRDPDHNEQVGGAPRSLHVSFNALDIIPMRSSTERTPIHTIVKLLEKDPYYPFMGIGVYNSFVHIDTRGLFTRGARGSRWGS